VSDLASNIAGTIVVYTPEIVEAIIDDLIEEQVVLMQELEGIS
jgi:hypothetical protein